MNEKHYGKLLDKYIRANGITITHVAKKLGIKRPTLYNRIKDNSFSADELKRVLTYLKLK
jgi:predicted transcriptional regulator